MTANAVRYPAAVVPIRYAVTFADASTAVAFPGLYGPSRSELAAWIADRAVDEYVRLGLSRRTGEAREAAKRYAVASLGIAEAYGNAELFAWDVPAILEAWQRPELQGEADALAAYLAAAERHGLTEADMAAGTAAYLAEADATELAAEADGTYLGGAATVGPLAPWECELIAERTAAAAEAATGRRTPRPGTLAARLDDLDADAALERQAAANAAELAADAEARRAAYAAELDAEAAAELAAAKAAEQDRAELDAEPACNAERVAPGFRCPTHRVQLATPSWTDRLADPASDAHLFRPLAGSDDCTVCDTPRAEHDAVWDAPAGTTPTAEAAAERDAAELGTVLADSGMSAAIADMAAQVRRQADTAELADPLSPAELALILAAGLGAERKDSAAGRLTEAAVAARYAEADAWAELIGANAARLAALAAYTAVPRSTELHALTVTASARTTRAARKLAAILAGGAA